MQFIFNNQHAQDWALLILIFLIIVIGFAMVAIAAVRLYRIGARMFGYNEYQEIDLDENELLRYTSEQRRLMDIERSIDKNGFKKGE